MSHHVPLPLTTAVVLAAGSGKRMQSSLPKVLHRLQNKPLLTWVWEGLAQVSSVHRVVTVVSPVHEQVQQLVHENKTAFPFELHMAYQPQPLGTGHGVLCGLQSLSPSLSPQESILVAYGDTPLVCPATYLQLLQHHHTTGASVTILGFYPSSVTGYGRILLDTQGRFLAIREDKDCSQVERLVSLCHSGFMCGSYKVFADLLPCLTTRNAAGELYLTDVPGLCCERGMSVSVLKHPYAQELQGINSQSDLAALEKQMDNKHFDKGTAPCAE